MGPVYLKPSLQHYDWGEKGKAAYIPRLFGFKPGKNLPYAEAWIGAHPLNPSAVRRPHRSSEAAPHDLDRLIRSDPSGYLGSGTALKFRGELPFLVKVVAAEKGLSIQVHPDAAQARRGFLRERKKPKTRLRNYRDPNPKHELILALSEFRLLSGFRPLAVIKRLWSRNPELKELWPGKDRGFSLKRFFHNLMTMDQARVNLVLTAHLSRLKRCSISYSKRSIEYWFLKADRERSAKNFKDRGLFAFYLLNLVRLKSGQGHYIPPGKLHAHLEGRGIEMMSNSDNVIRGGLTGKHTDIPELLKITSFTASKPKILKRDARGFFRIPTETFLPRVLEFRGSKSLVLRPEVRPRILLAIKGQANLECTTGKMRLSKGKIVFLPPQKKSWRIVPLRRPAILYTCSIP